MKNPYEPDVDEEGIPIIPLGRRNIGSDPNHSGPPRRPATITHIHGEITTTHPVDVTCHLCSEEANG